MNILIMGAGAIGRYVGGSLQAAGEGVTFYDIPQVAGDPKARDLSIRHGEKSVRLTIDIISDLQAYAQNTIPDLVIMAVKSFDTESAIETLANAMPNPAAILCLQNGVENETLLRKRFGAECVIYGTVTTAIGRKGAEIIVEKLRGIGIASSHPLTETLLARMNTAGLKAQRLHSATGMKWSKLLTNIIANASSAILDMTPAEIIADKALFAVEIQQMRETLRVMKALKVPVTDLPGTAVKALAFVANNAPLWLAQRLLAKAIGSGRGGKMPSFHIDLKAGRGKTEITYLNGAVARFGAHCGVATPVNAYLTATLEDIVAEPADWQHYAGHPERYLSELARVTP